VEYVEKIDIKMDGKDGMGKGNGNSKDKDKGKGKATGKAKAKEVEGDDGMVLDEQTLSQTPDAMNIDELLDSRCIWARCVTPGTIRIKPLSSTSDEPVLPPTSNDGPTTPAARHCK
jgi:hypothetical protein